MKRRLAAFGAALLFSLSLLAGCGGAPAAPDQGTQPGAQEPGGSQAGGRETVYPLTITDDAGREVTIPAEPKRVVSVAPSNTEILFALGKGNVLVGRSEFDEYPPEALEVDSIGGYDPPNYELILSKEPDLVLAIGGSGEALNKLTSEYGLTVVVIDSESFTDVYDAIRLIGQILNVQEKAEELASAMEQRVREIAEKAVQAETRPKVFYEVWNDPLMTAGTGTFIDELIRLAGGENVGAVVQGWSSFSLEQVVASDPDIIMAGSHFDTSGIASRPGWGEIKAVKDGKVYPVEDPDLVTLPGPRLVQGLEWMARTIHPEIFSE